MPLDPPSIISEFPQVAAASTPSDENGDCTSTFSYYLVPMSLPSLLSLRMLFQCLLMLCAHTLTQNNLCQPCLGSLAWVLRRTPGLQKPFLCILFYSLFCAVTGSILTFDPIRDIPVPTLAHKVALLVGLNFGEICLKVGRNVLKTFSCASHYQDLFASYFSSFHLNQEFFLSCLCPDPKPPNWIPPLFGCCMHSSSLPVSHSPLSTV